MTARSTDRDAYDAWFAAATFETMSNDWHWAAWQAATLRERERICAALLEMHERSKHSHNYYACAVRELMEPSDEK